MGSVTVGEQRKEGVLAEETSWGYVAAEPGTLASASTGGLVE